MVIEKVQSRFAEVDHGVQLMEVAGGYILVPKPELWGELSPHYGSLTKSRLSRAAVETLAIIAYSQPITRSEIESIRGVSSDTLIRSLYERNLISDMGRKDAPGRPIQYGTSTEFLRSFGLASIANLPKLSDSDRDKFSGNG
jgi:segregation and condensation protein B